MAIDWHERLAAPVEAVEHGLAQVDTIETSYVGPWTPDRMDYPVGTVMPVAARRTDGNEWTHEISAFLAFEIVDDIAYVEAILHTIADVISECLSALAATECVISYVPQSVESFVNSEDSNRLMVAVDVTFEASVLIDLADGP